MRRRTFLKHGALWLAAPPMLMLPRKSKASQLMQVIARRNDGGGPWQQVVDDTGVFTVRIGDIAGREYMAGSFTAANTGAVSNIQAYMREFGTPGAYTFSIGIWSESGGNPAAPITNGTIAGLSYADLAGSFTQETFTFSTPPSIAASTVYYVVIHADQIDAANYIQAYYNATGTEEVLNGDGTPTWSDQDGAAFLRLIINGES